MKEIEYHQIHQCGGHWLRCFWVGLMWGNSSQVNIHEALPQPETCGWNKESDGSFTFDWECNEFRTQSIF